MHSQSDHPFSALETAAARQAAEEAAVRALAGARARLILGTTTKKDTINGALREVVRRDAAAAFLTRARDGVFGALTGHEPGNPA